MNNSPDKEKRLLASDVRRLCGEILDSKVTAILATGATLGDLEAAVAWRLGEDDVMDDTLPPLSGDAAAVYDILVREDEFLEEEEGASPSTRL